jgi:hypothetical protein
MAASTTKIPRQSVTCSNWPPTSGARIGASPPTSMSKAKKRAAATPVCRSRTTARAMTMPAAPAAPWMSRKASSAQMVGAMAHSSEATM